MVLACLIPAGVVLLSARAPTPQAPEKAPALSETQSLKGQNFILKAQNLALQKASIEKQLKDAEAELVKEQTALAAEFAATLKCTAEWDWQTMGCAKPPEKPATEKK